MAKPLVLVVDGVEPTVVLPLQLPLPLVRVGTVVAVSELRDTG
jgi:hypothetical protein